MKKTGIIQRAEEAIKTIFQINTKGIPGATGGAGVESEYIKKDGSVDFTGDQSMGNHKLTDVSNPADDQDAATKKYVDDNAGGNWPFGDGSDGDVTLSSDTTLTRDMYYNNLTIDSGVTLNPNGYRIFVKGTLTNNGTIARNGNNGGNGGNGGGCGGNGGNGGGGGAALPAGTIKGSPAGANGGNGGHDKGDGNVTAGGNSTGVDIESSLGEDGAAGGKGGDGGHGNGGNGGSSTAGTKTDPHTSFKLCHLPFLLEMIDAQGDGTFKPYNNSAGSAGGGGGGGGGHEYGYDWKGGAGGGGGGAGSAGGIIFIAAKNIAKTGTIEAKGGNGGNGGDGGDSVNQSCGSYTGGGGGGGGGAGGDGGIIILVYKTKADSGSLIVTGGSGGSGGSGGTGTNGTSDTPGYYGENGADGADGKTGSTYLIQV